MFKRDTQRRPRWYFGGISATLAVPVTYPVDAIKTGIEIEQVLEKISIWRYLNYIRLTSGLLTLYSGLFYSMHATLIGATIRFGVSEKLKAMLDEDDIPFLLDVIISTTSGALGGFLKTPHDVIVTQMQADLFLDPRKRRKSVYRFDCSYKSLAEAYNLTKLLGGYRRLFCGAQISMIRTILLTVGQICFYDKTKHLLMTRSNMKDDLKTHLLASSCSAMAATILTQPFDVIRAKYVVNPEDYLNIWDTAKKQAHTSMIGFYRGSLLTFIKLGPQTVVTFILLEQLRLHFGYYPKCYYVDEPRGFFTRTYQYVFGIKPPPPSIKCDP